MVNDIRGVHVKFKLNEYEIEINCFIISITEMDECDLRTQTSNYQANCSNTDGSLTCRYNEDFTGFGDIHNRYKGFLLYNIITRLRNKSK